MTTAMVLLVTTIKTLIVADNFTNNASYDIDESTTTKNKIINDQNGDTGANFDYGICDASWNACETIATHNAKVLKGMDSTLTGTIVDFQMSGAMMACGVLGSNPYSIGKVLSRSGIEYSMVGLDEMTSPGIYIISYWNEGAPWNGLHTVAISYDGTSYTTYNYNGSTSNSSPSSYAKNYICGYYLR